jgi:hypothetical protein
MPGGTSVLSIQIFNAVNTTMKNLYLFHYLGGTCGDFICLEVSKDSNFYSNGLLQKTDDNRWLGTNPLAEFNLDYKENVLAVSPETYNDIDKKFQEYNLIIPAHHVKRNLPRLKVIRSYVEDTHYIPMFFMMLYIKAWASKRTLSDAHDFLFPLGNLHTSHTMYKMAKNHYSNLKYSAGNKLIAEIDERGYYYNFELRALTIGLVHMKSLVHEHYPVYKSKILNNNFSSDIHLPVDQLLVNPTLYVNDFAKQINMAQPLDIEKIREYHQANLNLFENKFNKSYDKLVQGNWQDEFKEYLDYTCPNNWFSRTNQQP